MKARIFAVLVAVTTTNPVEAETPAQALSAEHCAVLRSEYGVIPPACIVRTTAPAAATIVTSVVRSGAAPAPVPQMTARVRDSHVFFPLSGATLDDAARNQLVHLAGLLSQPELRDTCLLLTGHSDSSGKEDVNRKLSQERAEVVGAFLATVLTTPPTVVIAPGKGSAEPLDGFPASATVNRRVAIMARRCP